MQQLNQFIKLKHILINSKKYNSLPAVQLDKLNFSVTTHYQLLNYLSLVIVC